MTQTELANSSGVSLTTINAMMHNKTRQVSLDTLDKLARALDVAPGDLLSQGPLCGLCHRPALDQAKVPDRSLYQVWCARCGVYFVGGMSRAQLLGLTPEEQRLLLADQMLVTNARGSIGMVWGHPVEDADGALERMDSEVVERFFMMHDGHLLRCERDRVGSGSFAEELTTHNWRVQVDTRPMLHTGIRAGALTKRSAMRAVLSWYNGPTGPNSGKRRK